MSGDVRRRVGVNGKDESGGAEGALLGLVSASPSPHLLAVERSQSYDHSSLPWTHTNVGG